MQEAPKKRGFPFKKKAAEETPEAREAREAAEREVERIAAENAARLNAIGEAWAEVSERVRAALPSPGDPRQAYYLSLSRQGREAEEQGRGGVAAHCRACVDQGLETIAALAAAQASSQASPRAPASPSALATLKSRWDASARARAGELLRRHAARLAPSEREAYAASVEALSASPDKNASPSAQQTAQSNQGKNAQALRRKLIDRLMRADVYRRRAARLRGWTASPAPVSGPAGPYNDFAALEDALRRVAASHPEWAAEFLDLYGNMNALRDAYRELLPKSKV